jgi:predicted Zn-dependent peptidase
VPTKSETATLLVMVGAGSKYETDDIGGLSHFLEHMFFKGTKKRSNTRIISEYLDEIGGEYNAFTSKEYTGFYAKVAGKFIDRAFNFISDILLNSKFESKEIEREKGVIIEEMNMYQDTPMAYVSDLFETLLYKNQPAGRLTVGTKKSILAASRPKFIRYYEDLYVASNVVVCLAGDFNHEKAKEKVNKYFKKIFLGEPKSKKKVIEKQKEPQVFLQTKKTDQTHFCLGMRAYDLFHPKRFALELLSIILGGSMSSRLFISVRERLGLAYYIRSSVAQYTDSGYLVIQAGVDNKKVDKAITTCLSEFKKILTKKIPEKELIKAKEYFKGKTLIGLETSDELAFFCAQQEILTKKIETIEELFKKIGKVSLKDLQEVAFDTLTNKKLNLALIGPFEDKNRFLKILKIN